jgi:hypothetical protein
VKSHFFFSQFLIFVALREEPLAYISPENTCNWEKQVRIMNTSDGWPVKRMSGENLAFAFPYGARALQAERAKVQKVLDLSGQIDHGFNLGGNENPVFKVPLSLHEGFVRNDAERIWLADRVRNWHNCHWKKDVFARPSININYKDGGSTRTEKHYATLMDNLIEMQALTHELKPETLALISSCQSEHELQQAMLNARA